VVAALACSGGGKSEDGPQAPVTFGLIVPLTGSAAEFGIHEQNAALILRDELKESDGVQIELAIEDSKGEPTTGLSAFRKILSTQPPVGVYTELSSVSLAIAPVAQENRTIMISVAANPALTKSNSYAFRNFPDANRQAVQMAAETVSSLGIKRVAIFHVLDDFGESMKEAYGAEVASLGGKVVANESFPPDGTDLKAQAAKLIAARPEAIYVVGYGQPLGTALRQLREQGFEGRLLSGLEVAFEDVLTSARGAANDVIYLDVGFDPYSDDPKVAAFVKTYETRFNKTPSMVAALAYDGLTLLAEAVAAVGSDPDRLRDHLMGVSGHPGLCGEIHITEDRDIITPLVMKILEDGKPHLWKPSQ